MEYMRTYGGADQLYRAGEEERRYTPQAVAELWECSIETVYELLRKGKLHGFKLGRDWRITESELRAYEQNPENQAAKIYNKPNRKMPVAVPRIMRVV